MAYPTKSFEVPVAQDRFRVLPAHVRTRDVVRAARNAGLGFMTGAAFGFRRVDLRQWRLEQYETAVSYSRIGVRAVPWDDGAGLDDRALDRLVRSTRERVLRMLQSARRTWGTPTFARDMIDFRLVVAIYDRDHEVGYAPASNPEMRLVDRVASLFIADFLTDASDYAIVTPCDQCGEVGLGGVVDHASWCLEAPTNSHVIERVRRSRTTLRGVGVAEAVGQ
ncbi:MAG TPA: hypothetical protein VIF62_36960 [Labilithrix sp.]|jgi:hypothetical protein